MLIFLLKQFTAMVGYDDLLGMVKTSYITDIKLSTQPAFKSTGEGDIKRIVMSLDHTISNTFSALYMLLLLASH